MSATLPRSSADGWSLTAFFLLTYLVSWSLFVAGARLSGASTPPAASISGVGGVVIVLGVFAPSFVALALTAKARGRAGAAALLKQVIPRPVAARWYVFAIVFTAAIKLGAALLYRITTGSWPAIGTRVAWLTVALLWVCAAYLLAQMNARSPTGQETAERREGRLAGEAAVTPERTDA